MLPAATAMENTLNGDLDELSAMGADSGDLPAEALDLPEPQSVAETPPDFGESSVAEPEADNGGGRRLAIVGLLLAVAGVQGRTSAPSRQPIRADNRSGATIPERGA